MKGLQLKYYSDWTILFIALWAWKWIVKKKAKKENIYFQYVDMHQSDDSNVNLSYFKAMGSLHGGPPDQQFCLCWTLTFATCTLEKAEKAFISKRLMILYGKPHGVTLSTCIVSHNNALLAMLVSNNFSEIKSNVFKRVSKENLHSLVYSDTVERFHITAFVLFVLAQNILESEGPWFGSFFFNALLVYMCEMFVDVVKHSFLAKFNEIKPAAYSEFLEALCKQTLGTQSEESQSNLTFIPLAPACVVIRVLSPIYAAHIPYGPLPWRLFWIFILSGMTYIMLVTLKIMVGLGLHLHARWYVDRCLKRRHHLHMD